MPNVESLVVKIKLDKRFGKLAKRTCKSLLSLGKDGLLTDGIVDIIIKKVGERLKDMIIIGKVNGDDAIERGI